MQPIRIRFAKLGRARYISHLDLNRCMLRAVRRAGLPLWFTQGFNPHPYVTFALPLSIFFGGTCEIMDARLEGEMPFDEVKDRLSRQMPEGIEILEVAEPVMKPGEIAFARYEMRLSFDGVGGDELGQAFGHMLEKDALVIEKATKRGSHPVDIKPYLAGAEITAKQGLLLLNTVLPAGQETINPVNLEAALEQHAGLHTDFADVTRTEIYNGAMEPFR